MSATPSGTAGDSWSQKAISCAKGIGRFIRDFSNQLGVWCLSLIATLALPCLPLLIEWMKAGQVKADTLTLTSAVLAAGLLSTAEHKLYFSAYIVLFIVSLLLNLDVGPSSPANVDKWEVWALVAIIGLHSSERFWWHMVLDRAYPDWMKDKASSERAETSNG